MKVIFIRHPETEANVKKLIYGRTESGYSEKGKASVGTVVEQLSDTKIDAIYSSPLRRAADLAEAIAEVHGLEVTMEDRLQEMHFGIFENKTSEEAREIYGEGFDDFWYDFVNFQVPEGENLGQVRNRAVEFLQELLAPEASGESFADLMKKDPAKAVALQYEENRTVAVVAHSLVIRGALSWILNIPLEEIWRIDVKPAAIVEVTYRRGFGFLTGLR